MSEKKQEIQPIFNEINKEQGVRKLIKDEKLTQRESSRNENLQSLGSESHRLP